MSKIIIFTEYGTITNIFSRRNDIEIEYHELSHEYDEGEAKESERRLKQIEKSKTYKDLW